MRRQYKIVKNPWIAAVLNFFFPGLGFVYLGQAEFVLGGIVLFGADLTISCVALAASMDTASFIIVWTVFFSLSFLWAILGYISAEYVNKHND